MANRTRRISRSLPKRSLPPFPIRHRSTAMRNFASRRYSIDHNARREKEREEETERYVEFRDVALFISRNEFGGRRREKVHGCPVARISLLSLSLSSFVYLTLLSRAFFSYAPSSTYVGGLDGWSLFVFRYAKLRPGISRGLGKLRSPSATTDRKQDGRLKKKKRGKKKRDKKRKEKEKKRIYSSHAR